VVIYFKKLTMIKHVFGPVASRRLGISLGVDIIPYKTCTLDCLYCECGKTTTLSLERESFVDSFVVLQEIRQAIIHEPHIDFITFSGGGEPTLNKDIGTIISKIKEMTSIPVAIITNGTLLYRSDVRDDILLADLVLPSLDAASRTVFEAINKPHKDLDLKRMIDGLITFGKSFSGKIWLEVFIAEGINDSDDELDKIHDIIIKVKPEKVQLNSLDRPPAYENVQVARMKTLERIVTRWQDLPVEIIRRVHRRNEISEFSQNLENNIMNTIHRRPMTVEDLEFMTGKTRKELFKYIDILEKEKKISPKIIDNKIFYSAISNS